MQPTLVIGASENVDRYAYKAVRLLRSSGHEVIAFGNRAGTIGEVEIHTEWNSGWRPDTVTLYINPKIQETYYQQIIELKPRRVIFNPGTENREFEEILENHSIEVAEACTLVLLTTGQY
jgi:predicted CoA-binding protein